MMNHRFYIFIFAVFFPFILFSGGKPHEHDGLFLRGSIGPACSYIPELDSGKDVTSFGYITDLTLGYAVNNNFVFNAVLIHSKAFSVSNATLNDPINPDDYDVKTDVNLGFTGVGFGFNYYFMPSNIYLSPSLGFGSVETEMSDIYSSNLGKKEFFLNLRVGKEFWMTKDFAFGIALQTIYTSMNYKLSYYRNSSHDFLSFSFVLSLTYS